MSVNAATLDRCPPYDEEAERCVLGCMIGFPGESEGVLPLLRDVDFYLPDHQKVFRAITALRDHGGLVDTVTVLEQLLAQGDSHVPPDYLLTLVDAVPSARHWEPYAEIVRKKSQLRNVIAGAATILREAYDGGADPSALLDRVSSIATQLACSPQGGDFLTVCDALQEAWDTMQVGREEGGITGLRTGFNDLDRMTGGLQRGDLVILAGRPSSGKTSFALNVARHVGQHSPVGLFSLEVSGERVARSMLSMESRVNLVNLGYLNELDWARLTSASATLANLLLDINHQSSLHIGTLKTMARALKVRWVQRHGTEFTGLIIVDYLQRMKGERQRNDTRESEVASISNGLKDIAVELDCPVLALSQLSRAIESRDDHRPRLSDLRESGAQEQDADVVMFMHRPSYYDQNGNDSHAELIIGKQRSGPTGVVPLVFSREFMRFDNASEEDLADAATTPRAESNREPNNREEHWWNR